MVYGEQDIRMSFYALYDELDVSKVIKIGRWRWLGHLFRMLGLDPCRKRSLLKPEGTRLVGKPTLTLLKSLEEDLRRRG
jgi:hypothetical protein